MTEQGHPGLVGRRPAAQRLAPILLVALATVVALLALGEGLAHALFRKSATSTMACLIVNDPTTGVRGIPGSICRQKDFESPLVAYRFNDCGFRTPQPCRAATPGVYRIVLIGSSVGYGMHVDQPQGLAARLGPMLSERLKRPVDVYNESMQWGFPASWALRTTAMLQPHPDMILWALTPFDIENVGTILPYVANVQQGSAFQSSVGPKRSTATAPLPKRGLTRIPGRAWHRLMTTLWGDPAIVMLQHYLYRSQSQYLSHTLAQGDSVDYLRVPEPAALQGNLAIFAQALRRVADRARAAKVPLVVTLVPSRPQAIMLSNRTWRAGFDPNQLGRLLRPIVETNGARYIDMTPGLAAMPDAGQDYLSVDEHPTPEGHRKLAILLASALVRSGVLPAGRIGQP